MQKLKPGKRNRHYSSLVAKKKKTLQTKKTEKAADDRLLRFPVMLAPRHWCSGDRRPELRAFHHQPRASTRGLRENALKCRRHPYAVHPAGERFFQCLLSFLSQRGTWDQQLLTMSLQEKVQLLLLFEMCWLKKERESEYRALWNSGADRTKIYQVF